MSNPAAAFSDIQSRLQVADPEQLALNVLNMAMALSLGKSAPPQGSSAHAVLSEAMTRLREILPWEGMAFYLAHGDDFHLTLCHPKSNSAIVARQIRRLIQDGVFALSVRDSWPVTAYDSEEGQRLILGPINVKDKLKGVFLGGLRVEGSAPSALLLSLIKLVLGWCAESLECRSQCDLLRNNYSFLQSVSETLAILSLSPKGKLSFVSPEAARLLGTDDSYNGGKSLADYLLLPEDVLFPVLKPIGAHVKLRDKPVELQLHLLPAKKESSVGVILPVSGIHV